MSGTHIVHDQFYGDEERFAQPQIVTVEAEYTERRVETMAEKIAFKVKVHPQTDPENPSRLYRIRVFEFHAESWEEALAYAREKGEPLSIALAKVE